MPASKGCSGPMPPPKNPVVEALLPPWGPCWGFFWARLCFIKFARRSNALVSHRYFSAADSKHSVRPHCNKFARDDSAFEDTHHAELKYHASSLLQPIESSVPNVFCRLRSAINNTMNAFRTTEMKPLTQEGSNWYQVCGPDLCGELTGKLPCAGLHAGHTTLCYGCLCVLGSAGSVSALLAPSQAHCMQQTQS